MDRETPTKCDLCGNGFILTAGGGRYIRDWDVNLCQTCLCSNHDGFPADRKWASFLDLRTYLLSNDVSFREREGLLHWTEEALNANRT